MAHAKLLIQIHDLGIHGGGKYRSRRVPGQGSVIFRLAGKLLDTEEVIPLLFPRQGVQRFIILLVSQISASSGSAQTRIKCIDAQLRHYARQHQNPQHLPRQFVFSRPVQIQKHTIDRNKYQGQHFNAGVKIFTLHEFFTGK